MAKILKDPFCQSVIKHAVGIVLICALARFTSGWACLLIALVGCVAGVSNKCGFAIASYITLPFLLMVNSVLIPKASSVWGMGVRIGSFAIAACMVIGAMRRHGQHRLPFAGLILFLMVAAISSIGGYAPVISYLKMLNFLLFILGLWLGTQNIQKNPRDVAFLRSFVIGIVVVVVVGSLATLPFPTIAYSTSLKSIVRAEGEAAAISRYRDIVSTGGQTLFAGIMVHSQALAPTLAMSLGLVLSDMLFVEREFKLPHIVLIGMILPMLFMSRSRVALFSSFAAFSVVFLYSMNKVKVRRDVKMRLKKAMFIFLSLMAVGLVVLEIKNHTISRWLRKTQDVENDDRSLSDAVTSSRMGLVEESMYDFSLNPLFGKGFQVSYGMENLSNANGLILSAPIEKGVLPVMLLGEVGIVGTATFVIFLIMFYSACRRRKLFVTSTMFTVLLASNMGEATFFSPGGVGGLLWVLAVVGGFVIDTSVLYGRSAAANTYNGMDVYTRGAWIDR